MPTLVYPESFFNINHPSSPWFSIQFRKETGTNLTLPSVWTELATFPNNYVESLKVVDNGGAAEVELVLFDRYFTTIENIVMQSLFVARNSGSKQFTTASSSDFSSQVTENSSSLINMRIRFGYATSSIPTNNYLERKPDETITMTPWLYLMINGVNNNASDGGLRMTIQALSLTSTLLNRYSMVDPFGKLKGKPKVLLQNIGEFISSATNRKITIEKEEEPIENGEEEIEIILGTAKPDKDERTFKNIKLILDEYCSKVPPKLQDENGNFITKTELEAKTEVKQEKVKRFPYTYEIIELAENNQDPNSIIAKIKFYYAVPNDNVFNGKMRAYVWREHAGTIVRNLNITTPTDFATMSSRILIKNGEENIDLELAAKTPTDAKDVFDNNDVDSVKIAKGKGTWKFVSDVVSKTNDQSIDMLVSNFIDRINYQISSGTLEIEGDPYYLFDKNFKVLQSPIKIIINRPGENGIAESSYLSGYYLVKGITHTIDSSGFSTVLDIIKHVERKK